jgi:hypothetical protein
MHRTIHRILRTSLAAATLLLASCATPYRPANSSGGYSETFLATDTVRVFFRGNGQTEPERTHDFAMLRAAELGTQRGFKYMIILNGGNRIEHDRFTTPNYGVGFGFGAYRTVGRHGFYTGGIYGPPWTVHDIYRASTDLLVKYLPSKDKHPDALETDFIVGSIRSKYRMPHH